MKLSHRRGSVWCVVLLLYDHVYPVCGEHRSEQHFVNDGGNEQLQIGSEITEKAAALRGGDQGDIRRGGRSEWRPDFDIQQNMAVMFCGAIKNKVLPYDKNTRLKQSHTYRDPELLQKYGSLIQKYDGLIPEMIKDFKQQDHDGNPIPSDQTLFYRQDADVETQVIEQLFDFLQADHGGEKKVLYSITEHCPGILYEVVVRQYFKSNHVFPKHCQYQGIDGSKIFAPSSTVVDGSDRLIDASSAFDVVVSDNGKAFHERTDNTPPSPCHYPDQPHFGHRLNNVRQQSALVSRFLRVMMKIFMWNFSDTADQIYGDSETRSRNGSLMTKEECHTKGRAEIEKSIVDSVMQEGVPDDIGDVGRAQEIAKLYTDFLGDELIGAYVHPDCVRRNFKEQIIKDIAREKSIHENLDSGPTRALLDDSPRTAGLFKRMGDQDTYLYIANMLATGREALAPDGMPLGEAGREALNITSPTTQRTLFYMRLCLDTWRGFENLLTTTAGEGDFALPTEEAEPPSSSIEKIQKKIDNETGESDALSSIMHESDAKGDFHGVIASNTENTERSISMKSDGAGLLPVDAGLRPKRGLTALTHGNAIANDTCFTFLCGSGASAFNVLQCLRRITLGWGDKLLHEDAPQCVVAVSDRMPTEDEIREKGLSRHILAKSSPGESPKINFVLRNKRDIQQIMAEVHETAAERGKKYIILMFDVAHPTRRNWDIALVQSKEMLDFHEQHRTPSTGELAISLLDRVLGTGYLTHFPSVVDTLIEDNGIRVVNGEVTKMVGGKEIHFDVQDPGRMPPGAQFPASWSFVNSIATDFWLHRDSSPSWNTFSSVETDSKRTEIINSVTNGIRESFVRVLNLAAGVVRATGFDNILGGSHLVQKTKYYLDKGFIRASPWPVFCNPEIAWDVYSDAEVSMDVWFFKVRNTRRMSQFTHLGISQGFVSFVEPFAEASSFQFSPGLHKRIFPDQMVSYAVDQDAEKFIKDPDESFRKSMNLFMDYEHAEEDLVAKDVTASEKDDGVVARCNPSADAASGNSRVDTHGNPIIDTAVENINISIHFEHLDFSYSTRELFGNNLMDIVEFLNIFSTQGGNSYIIPPIISDYVSQSLDSQKFEEGRQKFKRDRIEKYGQGYWDQTLAASFDAENPNDPLSDKYRYWVWNGPGDFRTWKPVSIFEFFDQDALNKYLKSRGSGGLSMFGNELDDRNPSSCRDIPTPSSKGGSERGAGKHPGKDAGTDPRKEAGKHPGKEAGRHPGKECKNRPTIILEDGVSYRKLDLLLVSESLQISAGEYTAPTFTILPCEDSDIPIRFRFARNDYYIERVRCVVQNEHPWVDFKRMTEVLREETQRKYEQVLYNRKMEKRWDDLLENSGHNRKSVKLLSQRKSVESLNHARKKEGSIEPDAHESKIQPYESLSQQQDVPVSYMKRLFDEKTGMNMRDFKKFDYIPEHGHDSSDIHSHDEADTALMVGFYSVLLEGMESEKLHQGKYKSWSPNESAPSVWSGLTLHHHIREYGLKVRAAMERVVRAKRIAKDGDGEMAYTVANGRMLSTTSSLSTNTMSSLTSRLSSHTTQSIREQRSSDLWGDFYYWAIHWRRGDGHLGPASERIQQFERAAPDLLYVRVKDLLLGRRASFRRKDFHPEPKHYFIMTNERNTTSLEQVRDSFRKELDAEVYFLSDFSGNNEIGDSSGDSDNNEIEDLSIAGLSTFLNRESIMAMFIEMEIACHANEFVGYGLGPFQGGDSVPSLLVQQLRLWRCNKPPPLGLFFTNIELVRQYH